MSYKPVRIALSFHFPLFTLMKSYLLLGIGLLAITAAAQTPTCASTPSPGYNPTSSPPPTPQVATMTLPSLRPVVFQARDLGIMGYDSFRRVPSVEYARATNLAPYKAPELTRRRTLARFSEYRSPSSDEPNQA